MQGSGQRWEQLFLSAAASAGLIDGGLLGHLQTLIGTGRLLAELEAVTQGWPPGPRQQLVGLVHQAQAATASGRVAPQPGWGTATRPETRPDTPPANHTDTRDTLLETARGSGAREVEAQRAGGGETIGPYVVEEEIAKGGMGVVLRARHGQLGHRVAIKVLSKGAEASPATLRRFAIEGRAAAQLRHPNVAAVHELGESAHGPYLVMDYIEGGTLGDLVRSEGQLPARRAVEVVRGAASGLAYAHRHGILHRDIKPDNILIDEDGTPRVTDFGLARELESADDDSQRLTRAGALLGTPAYMSPEQAAGELDLVDRRSDVYGLGAVLYELLAGRLPFRHKRMNELLAAIVSSDPPRLGKLAPEVDADLERIVATCMAKDPEERYPHAQALADDLERWLRSEPISVRAPGVGERLRKWVRRNPALARTLFASVALSLLAILGSGGMFLTGVRRERDRAVEAEGSAREERDAAEQARATAEEALAAAERARASEAEARQGLAAALGKAKTQLERAERLLGENFELIAAQAVKAQDWRTALEFGTRALERGDTLARRLSVGRAQALAWRVVELGRHRSVGHGSPMDQRRPVLRWSTNGERLALLDPVGRELQVFDVQTQRRDLRVVAEAKAEPVRFAWSPQGDRLACVDSGLRVRIFGFPGGSVLRTWSLGLKKGRVVGMAWLKTDARDQLVIVGNGFMVRYDAATGERKGAVAMPAPEGAKTGMYRGPYPAHDGRIAVTITGVRLGGEIELFRHLVDVSARERAKQLGKAVKLGWMRRATWSSDDAWLLGDAGHELLFWKRPGQAHVVRLTADPGEASSAPFAAWAPSGATLAAAAGERLLLFRPPAREPFRRLHTHRDPIRGLSWLKGERVLATQSRRQVFIWREPFDRPWRTIPAREEFQAAPAWSAKGLSLLALPTSSGVTIWHPLAGVQTRIPLRASPLEARWHPRRPLLAVLARTRLFLLRPPPRQRPHVGALPGVEASRPRLLAWNHDGALLATARPADADRDGPTWAVSAWDPQAGRLLWNMKVGEPVKQLVWAGSRLLIKRASGLQWVSPRGKAARVTPLKGILRLRPSPDGKAVLACPSELRPGPKVVVLRAGGPAVTLEAPAGERWGNAVWTPDSREVLGVGGKPSRGGTIVQGAGNAFSIWRMSADGAGERQTIVRLKGASLGVTPALSPAGDVLAVVWMQGINTQRRLLLVDPATQQVRERIELSPGRRDVCWLDADHLAVFGSDSIDVFHKSGRRVRQIPVPGRSGWSVSPQRDMFCVVGGGHVELLDAQGARLFTLEKANVTRARWSPRGDQLATWGGLGSLLELISAKAPSGTAAQVRARATRYLAITPE